MQGSEPIDMTTQNQAHPHLNFTKKIHRSPLIIHKYFYLIHIITQYIAIHITTQYIATMS